jgi:hypothetical protein
LELRSQTNLVLALEFVYYHVQHQRGSSSKVLFGKSSKLGSWIKLFSVVRFPHSHILLTITASLWAPLGIFPYPSFPLQSSFYLISPHFISLHHQPNKRDPYLGVSIHSFALSKPLPRIGLGHRTTSITAASPHYSSCPEHARKGAQATFTVSPLSPSAAPFFLSDIFCPSTLNLELSASS